VKLVTNGQHRQRAAIRERYAKALRRLLAST
jgi:hypothetical protein